jgi:hypothetical protein
MVLLDAITIVLVAGAVAYLGRRWFGRRPRPGACDGCAPRGAQQRISLQQLRAKLPRR